MNDFLVNLVRRGCGLKLADALPTSSVLAMRRPEIRDLEPEDRPEDAEPVRHLEPNRLSGGIADTQFGATLSSGRLSAEETLADNGSQVTQLDLLQKSRTFATETTPLAEDPGQDRDASAQELATKQAIKVIRVPTRTTDDKLDLGDGENAPVPRGERSVRANVVGQDPRSNDAAEPRQIDSLRSPSKVEATPIESTSAAGARTVPVQSQLEIHHIVDLIGRPLVEFRPAVAERDPGAAFPRLSHRLDGLTERLSTLIDRLETNQRIAQQTQFLQMPQPTALPQQPTFRELEVIRRHERRWY